MELYVNNLVSGELLHQMCGDIEYIVLCNNPEYNYFREDDIYKEELVCNGGYAQEGFIIRHYGDLCTILESFSNIEHIFIVKIPENALVFIGENHYQSDLIKVIKKLNIMDLEIWKDYDTCRKMIMRTPDVIKYMKDPSENLCCLALDRDPYCIKYIDQSEKLCLVAINKNAHVLTHIKKKNRTNKIYYEAIKNDSTVINYIDKQELTIDMIEEVAKTYPQAIILLEKEYQTYDFMFDIIKNNGELLEHVRDDLKDVNMCNAAIENKPSALRFIPEKIKEAYPELVNKCFEMDHDTIYFINNPTREMKLRAIRKDPLSIRLIDNLEPEFCELAFSLNKELATYIVRDICYHSNEIIFEAIKQCPNIIREIKSPTDEMIKEAVKNDGYLLEFFDVSDKTTQWLALNDTPNAIKYIKNPSDEMCIYVLDQDPENIRLINNPSDKICEYAIKLTDNAYQDISDKNVLAEYYGVDINDIEDMEDININNNDCVINDSYIWQYDNMELTEEDHIRYIKQNPSYFTSIKDPSERVKLAALKEDGDLIRHIKNPTKEMCLTAVETSPNALIYMNYPDEDIVIAALVVDGRAISLVNNPSEEMMYVAIFSDPMAIKYIKNPPTELILIALEKSGKVIDYLDFKTDEYIDLAFKTYPAAIKHIKNPSEELCIQCVKKNGKLIQYISEDIQTINIQIAAINENPIAMSFIESQTEELCYQAIETNPKVLLYIKNQTIELCLYAVYLDPTVIIHIKDSDFEMYTGCAIMNIDSLDYIQDKYDVDYIYDNIALLLDEHNITDINL